MDQLICAALSHTHYWFEVGTLKVPASCTYYLWSHIFMVYGHTFSKSMDQPGKVANPARGELNQQGKLIILCPHTQAESGAYLRDPPEFRGGAHLFI